MLIIPQPSILDRGKGTFSIEKDLNINCDCEELVNKYRNIFDILSSADFVKDNYNISIEKAENLEFEYSIDITPELIEIRYSTEVALLYAFSTFKQMVTGTSEIPCGKILDKHRYDYRGVSVDTDKNFLTMEYLKTLADTMACYKLNRLHIRLNEHNLNGVINNISKESDVKAAEKEEEKPIVATENIIQTTEKNNSFTSAELKDLVSFCKDRFIEIIPEMDFSVCMENYFKRHENDSEKTTSDKDETIEYCVKIIGALANIFDGKLLHIGFENVSEKLWKKSDVCKDKMAETGIKKSYKLIEYFWEEIAKVAHSFGKEIVLFGNEIKAKPPKGAVLQWIHHDFKKTNCGTWMRRGGKCIISCSTYFYFNVGYNKIPLSKVYSFDMMFVGVPINLRKNVLGYECCFWNKKVDSISEMEKLLFPRLIAFAEKGWTTHSLSYKKFKKRLVTHESFLQERNVNFSSEATANPNIMKRAFAYTLGMQNRIKKEKKN